MTKITDYLKTINGGFKIWDYDKLINDDIFVKVIISERGNYGKTFNFILKAFDMWCENGFSSIYAKNLDNQIKISWKRFLKKVQKLYPQKFENTATDSYGAYHFEEDIDEKGNIKRFNKQYFIYFGSLSNAEKLKGMRENVNLIMIDEIMDGINYLHDAAFLLLDLIYTFKEYAGNEETLKGVILAGNFKTLNHPLFAKLNIWKIEKEVTDIKDNVGVIVRILTPIYDKQDIKKIEKENEKDNAYRLGKLIGYTDYGVFNNSLDIINNVVKKSDKLNKLNYSYKYIFYADSKYFHVFENGIDLHIIATDDYFGLEKVYRLKKNDLKENYPELSNVYKENIIRFIENNKITFENVYTRVNFIKSLI